MSKDNSIDTVAQWYAAHGPKPLFTAIIAGAIPFAATKLAWGPAVEVLRSLGRPIGTRILGGAKSPEAHTAWNTAMDNLKTDSALAKWLPRIFGGLTTVSLAGLFSNKQQPFYGLWKWHDDYFPKNASFEDMSFVNSQVPNSYVTDLDWNRPIHASNVVGLFKNDPHLDDEPYARNMGISIVQNAAMTNHTKQPTLGNIFDSAVNKIENKLTFGGLANVAMKTAVANGISRLFAGSLGAMCDLSPQAQQTLVDAGTWAGAVTSMLD